MLTHLAQYLLAPPTPTPSTTTPAPVKVGFNFDGITHTLMFQIAPIILTVIDIGLAMRASRGDWAKTLTTSGIAFIGIMFIAGGVTFLAAGDWLVSLFFK